MTFGFRSERNLYYIQYCSHYILYAHYQDVKETKYIQQGHFIIDYFRI